MKNVASIFFLVLIVGFSCSEEEHFQPVSITNFQPLEGEVGDLITIHGKNFDTQGRNQVWIGSKTLGFSADVIQSSRTQLTIKVPEGATTNYIWVECYHAKYILKASSPEQFIVIPSGD